MTQKISQQLSGAGKEIFCRRCGYNIRGLPVDGNCPECGVAVAMSVKWDLLRFADPHYVSTLLRGSIILLWGVRLLVIAMVALTAFTATGQLRDSSLLPLLIFMSSLPAIIGAWLLTTPDPGKLGDARYGNSRKIVRLALAVGLLSLGLAFVEKNLRPHSASTRTVLGLVQDFLSIVLLAGLAAKLVYLKKLAMRIPDHKLASQVAPPLMGIIIFRGLGLVSVWLLPFFPQPRPKVQLIWPLAYLIYLPVIFLGVLLIFIIRYVYFLGRFESRLAQQAALAQEAWSITTTASPDPRAQAGR